MLTRLIFGSMKESQSNREGWSFGLTVRLGTYRARFFKLSLFDSSLEIGVRAVKIAFDLSDAKMPDDDWAHDSVTNENLTVARERTHETEGGSSRSKTGKASLELAASASIEDKPGGKFSHGLKSEAGISRTQDQVQKESLIDKYTYERHAVVAVGDEKHPAWILEAVLEHSILLGTALKSPYFARVVADGPSPKVALHATISPHDVFVRDRTGAFGSVNKRLIAKIRIRRTLCKTPIPLDWHAVELNEEQDD
ncbi:hypothetical protein [Maritalea myrionectae]|uniref:hypothetical protein n=1 Tax=Maritalea myrionectae TaxID=454601 RepID=UPI00056252F4|nr:hypothetical protein [Maritalea myrionectae]